MPIGEIVKANIFALINFIGNLYDKLLFSLHLEFLFSLSNYFCLIPKYLRLIVYTYQIRNQLINSFWETFVIKLSKVFRKLAIDLSLISNIYSELCCEGNSVLMELEKENARKGKVTHFARSGMCTASFCCNQKIADLFGKFVIS